MKFPTHKYSNLLLLSLLLTFSNLFSQSVATDPVGYVSIDIVPGYNPIGINFCKPAAFTGKVLSSSANTLNLSAIPSLGEDKYYIEVLRDAESTNMVGERIDIASVDGTLVTLDVSAPHNTLPNASSIVEGCTITIRPHFTIGDFDSIVSNDVNTDDSFNPAKSDQILFFDNGFKTHINYEGTWYQYFGSFEDVTDKIIAPGTGFFYYRNPNAGTPTEITAVFSGVVRVNNFVQKLVPGYQLVSSGYPIDTSPSILGYSSSLEASTNFNPTESDLIFTWENGFRTHLLYDDGQGTKNWYQYFGDFNVVENSNLFSSLSAYVVFIKTTGKVVEVARPF